MPDTTNLPTTASIDNLPAKLEDQLTVYTPQIKAALPAHIPVDRFKRVVLTAINQQPELAQADRRSLFNSCVKAATDGLMPDGREAALVIFNAKNKETGQWDKKVQYMPMIAGVRKRMRNSGEVKSAESHVIYEKDQFSYELGDAPKIMHKPLMVGDRGKPIGAYAVINLTNGEVLREVMSLQEIEATRAVSRAKDSGPWVTWWTEMARKAVLRRCAKAAPMSSDLDDVLKRDEEMEPDAAPMLDAGAMATRPTRQRQQHIEHQPAAPQTAAAEPAEEPAHDADGVVTAEPGYDIVDATGTVESSHKTADDWAKHFAAAIGAAKTKKEIGYMVSNGDAWTTVRDEVTDDSLVAKIDGLYEAKTKEAEAAHAAARQAAAANPGMAMPLTPAGKPDAGRYVVLCQEALAGLTEAPAVIAFVVNEIENLKSVIPGTKRAVLNNVALPRWVALGGKQDEFEKALAAAVTPR